ncbi:MAG: hypothetical protein AB1938_26015 [Myxococcota bacterium]
MSSSFADAHAALERSVLEGPGKASVQARQAAADGSADDSPLGRYLAKVREAAYRVTPEELEALRATHSDDELFELTVAASLGAATRQLEAGFAAVAAAFEEQP